MPCEARADDPETATVSVVGKKEAVVKKIDKTLIDVSNLARAANGTAQDVLQSTPEVSVTADGQISVRGNSLVTVRLSLTVNANEVLDGSRRTYRTESSTFRQAGFDHFVARRLYAAFVKKIE